MKNLFKKEDNTGALIIYVALGAIAAGAITYLHLKKQSALKAAEVSKEHATDYLKHPHLKKKRTTDLHDLGKIAGIES